jgi:hypothetical protein
VDHAPETPLLLCSPVLPRRPPAPTSSWSLSVIAACRSGRAPPPFPLRGSHLPRQPPFHSFFFHAAAPAIRCAGRCRVPLFPPFSFTTPLFPRLGRVKNSSAPSLALVQSRSLEDPCPHQNRSRRGRQAPLPVMSSPLRLFSQTLGCVTFPSSSLCCRSTLPLPPSTGAPPPRQNTATIGKDRRPSIATPP